MQPNWPNRLKTRYVSEAAVTCLASPGSSEKKSNCGTSLTLEVERHPLTVSLADRMLDKTKAEGVPSATSPLQLVYRPSQILHSHQDYSLIVLMPPSAKPSRPNRMQLESYKTNPTTSALRVDGVICAASPVLADSKTSMHLPLFYR